MSIQAKVAAAVLCCFGLVGAGNVVLAGYLYRERNRRVGELAVRSAAETYGALERAETARLSAVLEALAANQVLLDAFRRRDRERLLAAALPIFERLKERHGISHWYFIDPEPARTIFLRVHRPELRGDVLKRPPFIDAVRTQDTAAGKTLGKTAFALRVAAPWRVEGRLVGYLELGEEMDQFLRRMKSQTGDDYGLLLEARHLDPQDWLSVRGAPPGAALMGQPILVERTIDGSVLGFNGSIEGLPEEGAVLGPVEDDRSSRMRGAVPVRDAAGQRVGALVVLRDVTAIRHMLERQRFWTLVVVLTTAPAAALLLYLLLHRLVFRRLALMTARMLDATTRLSTGEDVRLEPTGPERDELGHFEAFFGHFLDGVRTALGSAARRPPGGGGPARA